MATKKLKKVTLPNGLRILMVPQEGMATTALVLVEAGSKYETKDINGLSHFLEHLCFKGTTRRPKAIQISAELDGLGAEYNAFTSQEWTGYFAKARNADWKETLDLVSDLYLNPIFDAGELEKEKGVVIEELHMYEDTPQRKVHDIFQHLLYGDQPAGWDIGGEPDIIRKLNRDDVIAYRKKHYVAAATLVVVAGSFQEEEVLKEITKHFKGIPVEAKHGKAATTESQAKPALTIKHKESDQTHMVLGVRAFDLFDERRFALEVLADILGGGMSSKLFQKVRDELGAAYYVNAGADLATDHGFLAISAGIEHSKFETVLTAIIGECNKLKAGDFTDEEIKRAKNHLNGRLMLALESSDELAMYYGGQEILQKKMMTPDELVQSIERVTKSEIVAVAEAIFQDSKLNLAMIGPYKDEKPFEKLLHF